MSKLIIMEPTLQYLTNKGVDLMPLFSRGKWGETEEIKYLIIEDNDTENQN